MARSVILNVDLGKDPSITSEAGFFCMEYITSKSTKLALHCSITTSKHRTIAQKYKETSRKIQEVGNMLEHFYPHLFSCHNMALQFGLPLASQTAVCDLFKLFTKELFRTGLNWSRVVVLFVFAGALAVDCIRGNKTEFLKTIIYCVKKCVDDKLLEWIKENGGWDQINAEFEGLNVKPKWWLWTLTDGFKSLAMEKCECVWSSAMTLFSTK